MNPSAFVGRSGQEEYALVLTLGEYSVHRYAGGHLNDCLPDIHFSDSFSIDIEKRIIELYLK